MNGLNLDIKFGTERHNRIVQAIRARKRASDLKLKNRHKAWNKAEELSVMYMKESDNDSLRRVARDSSGVQDFTTVVVPYSQAQMMTAHTYLSSVFLNRAPILQFTGRHGEGQQQTMAVEALMDYQTTVGGHTVPYFIWLYDALKYGIGIIWNHWEEETRIVSEIVEKPVTLLGVETGKTKRVKQTKRVTGYVGNRLFNVRPYDYIGDPKVPLNQIQKGEFCGRVVRDFSLNDLVKGESEGKYFNVEMVRNRKGRQSGAENFTQDGSANVEWPTPEESEDSNGIATDHSFIELIEMYIRLIPKEWELGTSEVPEKWVFTLAHNDVLIGARPLGELHDEFPGQIIEQEIEGYSLTKLGLTEQLEPMNNVVTWLFNSHFYNVRAAMNNQFIYDPSKISRADIMDPSPGKRIRLRPDAWGSDVNTVLKQLPVADVTGNHLGDVDAVGQLMQRMSGVTDNVMGMVNPGGRKTATEVRSSNSLAINRLKTISEYMSAMGWSPLSQRLLQSTQQHYDLDRAFKVVGDITGGTDFLNVTPEAIAGFYDFVPVDGTLPIDRFAQVNLWKEILQGMNATPQIAQQYDLAGIFSWMAQLAGIRNINQFKINVQPDEVVQNEVQKGNVVAPPTQVPGLGPTQ